ncbi:MAG: hydroxyacylglutathione hydrolase [Methylophilaceae bacterium]|nr:hydroxyacylglutathione hydrolase [Methylophilaceae bacterium]
MIIEHSSNLIAKIEPIRAFQDNYIWAISNEQQLVVVDPGDAKPVFDFIQVNQLSLRAILITHKHPDHVGGVKELLNHYPDIQIFAPASPSLDFPYQKVVEGDKIFINDINLRFTVMETPGHTLDHIVYFDDENLFCGDTLFACGCGRIFEGSFEQMYASLNKLKKLKPTTKVFCAHEYTLNNIKFALTIFADNKILRERFTKCKNLDLTLPSSISEELKTNPFFLAQDVNQFKEFRLKKDAF